MRHPSPSSPPRRRAPVAAVLGAVLPAAFAAVAAGCGEGARPRPTERETASRAGAPSPAKRSAAWLARLPDVARPTLDAKRAEELAELSLGCVGREYPNKPSNVLAGPQEVVAPRELHPAFYGCFDWHSAVHGHWALARLLARFPEIGSADRIREALDARLTEERIAAEIAYFDAEHHRLFERPYGWGWLLRLQAELEALDGERARRWAAATRPLAERLAEEMIAYAEVLSVPVRAGTHSSTAYAFAHALDYARAVGDARLERAIVERSRAFFFEDRDCPAAYEPSGEDFISPCLAEADLMRRVLLPDRFARWLDGFLPPPHDERFAALAEPPRVLDRRDPRIGHLIGLDLQRAAAFDGVASALFEDDPRRAAYARLGAIHLADGLRQMFDSGYGGAHWLASFAIFALTGAGPPGAGGAGSDAGVADDAGAP